MMNQIYYDHVQNTGVCARAHLARDTEYKLQATISINYYYSIAFLSLLSAQQELPLQPKLIRPM